MCLYMITILVGSLIVLHINVQTFFYKDLGMYELSMHFVGFQLVEIILLSSCILCALFSCYVSGVVKYC